MKTWAPTEQRANAYNRAHVLAWITQERGADGWTTRGASNASWIEAARDLEAQGAVELRPAPPHDSRPSWFFRINPDFDG